MRLFNTTVLNLLTLLLLLSGVRGALAQEARQRLEAEFARIEQRIQEIEQAREPLLQQARAYAEQIRELKSKDKLNYFQHQKLEGLLKDSQDLSSRIEDLEANLREGRQAYAKTGRELMAAYDDEIRQNLKQLEKESTSAAARQAQLEQISTLRLKKESVQSRITPENQQKIQITKLDIEPDDSPRQIEQKADLLKDQEDKLRAYADRLKSKTQELQKELNLRTRINDLVTDLALFDQQEEAIGNINPSTSEVQADINSNPLGETATLSRKSLTEGFLVGQKDFDFSSLSSEQLEDAIEIFKKQEHLTQVRADSLAKQAERFYKAAQENKNENR